MLDKKQTEQLYVVSKDYQWLLDVLKANEQENAVLKKALEMACETIKEIMPDKPLYICGQAIADRLGIPMTSEIKDYEYFIEQAKESINAKRNQQRR